MLLLKAKVYITQDAGGTTYHYPSEWLDNKERITHILYPKDRSDQAADEKGLYQIVFPVVPEDLAGKLLGLPEFSIPSRTEVEAYASKHAPEKVVTTDQDAVNAVVAKIALGETLSKTDKDKVDPTSPEPGLVWTKPWLELVENDHGTIV